MVWAGLSLGCFEMRCLELYGRNLFMVHSFVPSNGTELVAFDDLTVRPTFIGVFVGLGFKLSVSLTFLILIIIFLTLLDPILLARLYHHHCHFPSCLLFSTLNSKGTFSLDVPLLVRNFVNIRHCLPELWRIYFFPDTVCMLNWILPKKRTSWTFQFLSALMFSWQQSTFVI